jgi:hypothetical protein
MPIETIEELTATLHANADWRVTPDVEKARAFVTAATKLILILPQSSADDGFSMTTNIQQVERQMQEAQSFLNQVAAGVSTSRVRFLTFRGFRR